MDRERIEGWLAVMDQVSYYELLGIAPDAGRDDIRRAFHGFAVTFHPDTHGTRSHEERTDIGRIFTRGTEAYRVLSDTQLRARYDEQRTRPGQAVRLSVAPQHGAVTAKPPAPPPPLPPVDGHPQSSIPDLDGDIAGRLEEHVKNVRARPFAQEAEALAKRREYVKARLQLQLAMNMDPDNPVLASYLSELQARIAETKSKLR
jgi:DnaJ-class molecular chaperone